MATKKKATSTKKHQATATQSARPAFITMTTQELTPSPSVKDSVKFAGPIKKGSVIQAVAHSVASSAANSAANSVLTLRIKSGGLPITGAEWVANNVDYHGTTSFFTHNSCLYVVATNLPDLTVEFDRTSSALPILGDVTMSAVLFSR